VAQLSAALNSTPLIVDGTLYFSADRAVVAEGPCRRVICMFDELTEREVRAVHEYLRQHAHLGDR